ncbi:MAG: S8 family serine peptidase [Leptolyngbyaceae cyanobacterium SU_3_3]|nr:S8 family serine peptidase [Leptolyngbyaceae cyanobacterium SU_3_3]
MNQPLVGVIDSGFGANEHGSKVVEAIQKENPQAQIWKGGGVGAGDGLKSLVEFVDTAKATGHTQAVANLSFDLTEVHPDGSISTRSQLTAEEQSALTYARDNGVLVVASSGNQGGAMSALGQASQPSDNLIVVGAANGQDRAVYSSYGQGLDLVAEGGSAGTSLAAAKVTGTIANIWNANPGLNDRQVSQILAATSTDLKTPGWDTETGAVG